MDLFEDGDDTGDGEDKDGGNVHEFTVSEISGAVKRTIEGEFGHVRVRGEVGRVVRARTGHLYFDLKDDRNVLASVSWKGQADKLAHLPEEGMEVIATGRLTTYGPQSKYQLNVEDVRPAGAGALMAMLEKRKAALAAEGLFAPERKRALPYLPEVIGVVTSPTGAVIRDILHRLRDRFPRKVLVWPVAVQGANCAPEVARAIEGFNRLSPGGALPRPDLIIVARGGGSIEDLWGFNEEVVARAAAASEIPLISAVGHETDTTLIDFVSDMRAPTPTAAAELAVPVRLELIAFADGLSARLSRALTQGVAQRQQRLRDLSRSLPRPEALTATVRQQLDHLETRLPGALRAATQKKALQLADLALRPGVLRRMVAEERRRVTALGDRLGPGLERRVAEARRTLSHRAERLRPEMLTDRLVRLRDRLAALDRVRETLGYEQTLARGFAVVRADGQVVTRAAVAEAAEALEIQFHDGRVTVGGRPVPRRKPKEPPPEQGTLI